jgi:hypothetical protein
MKRAVLVSLFVLLPCSFTLDAVAQTGLPPKFVFKTVSETTGIGLNASGSLTVEKTLPDGTVHGKVTLLGLRCGAENADYTGHFDGTKLTIPMPFEPAAQCRNLPPYVFVKKEGNRFEGRRNARNNAGQPVSLKITLDPVQ